MPRSCRGLYIRFLTTLVLIAEAIFLLERDKQTNRQTDRQTDRRDWTSYPTPAAMQPACVMNHRAHLSLTIASSEVSITPRAELLWPVNNYPAYVQSERRCPRECSWSVAWISWWGLDAAVTRSLLRRSVTEEASPIRCITSKCELDPLDMVEPCPHFYFAQANGHSIAINESACMYVCMYVCLSSRVCQKLHAQMSPHFLYCGYGSIHPV